MCQLKRSCYLSPLLPGTVGRWRACSMITWAVKVSSLFESMTGSCVSGWLGLAEWSWVDLMELLHASESSRGEASLTESSEFTMSCERSNWNEEVIIQSPELKLITFERVHLQLIQEHITRVSDMKGHWLCNDRKSQTQKNTSKVVHYFPEWMKVTSAIYKTKMNTQES